MKLRINQEAIMPTRPMTARVRVEEAAATAFCSPLLKRYLKPPLINMKRKTIPARETMT